jgi:deazaflavin-dependent oxidoreductase (nitroreductase family)
MLVLPTTPRGKAFDRLVFRWTGFSPMSFQFAKARRRKYRRQHVLLTTIGSKTGALRTSCLPYFDYEDKLVVCGSKSGGPKDPFWSNNLRKNPICWIRVKGKLIPAYGHVADGELREKVFDTVAEQHLGLRRYEELAGTHGRHVPLVLLTPRAPLPSGA